MRSVRHYYPVFLDLADRCCVVIGGGVVAQRKVTALLRHGAAVTLVSPTVTPILRTRAHTRRIRWIRRGFRPGDLRGAWLVHAATGDPGLNEKVWRAASRERTFTNVVDVPALCSFITPSMFRRGRLAVAVSTSGDSPALAKALRRQLQRLVGREYVPMLRLLRGLRAEAAGRFPSYTRRKRYFEELIRGEVFDLVRAGKMPAARTRSLELLERYTAKNGAS